MNDLPPGWARATVGDVTERVEAVNPKLDPATYFTYVDIGSIDNAANVIVAPKVLLGAKAPSRARQLLRAGDTVFSTVRTYLRKIGYVSDDLDGAVGSTGFSVLRPASGINSRYLYYHSLTNAFVDGLTAVMRGTSYPAVVDSQVREMPIPIAPTAEQERIVAAIEEQFSRLDAGVATLAAVHSKLTQLRASLLARCYATQAAQHGLVELEQKLGPETLFRDGDWVESKDQDPDGSFRLTQLADVGDGSWRNRSSRFMNGEQFARLNCTELRVGDILVARMPDPLGRSCLFPGDEMPSATVVDVAIIRVGAEGPVAGWLMWLLNSPQVRAQVAAMQKGTTRKRISRRNLATITVPDVPRAEQVEAFRKIETALSGFHALNAAYERSMSRAANLRAAILVSAFSGVLVPQDPKDEPASALLDRITADRATSDEHKPATTRQRRRKATA